MNNIISRERGSLTMELAFITPVMLILVIGSIFLGIMYINKSALLDASFVGAKSASYYGGDTQEVREDIYKTLETRYMSGPENVQVTIKYIAADGSEYEQTQSSDILEVISPAPAMPGASISVTAISNSYRLKIPLIPKETFDLVGTSVSRNNNQ